MSARARDALALLQQGRRRNEVARELGISLSYVARLAMDARRDGVALPRVYGHRVDRSTDRDVLTETAGRCRSAETCTRTECRHHITGAEYPCAIDHAELGGMRLEEIGELLGVTRERVRQIEEQALRTLRARAEWDVDTARVLARWSESRGARAA